jgi:hypothetical protein
MGNSGHLGQGAAGFDEIAAMPREIWLRENVTVLLMGAIFLKKYGC